MTGHPNPNEAHCSGVCGAEAHNSYTTVHRMARPPTPETRAHQCAAFYLAPYRMQWNKNGKIWSAVVMIVGVQLRCVQRHTQPHRRTLRSRAENCSRAGDYYLARTKNNTCTMAGRDDDWRIWRWRDDDGGAMATPPLMPVRLRCVQSHQAHKGS